MEAKKIRETNVYRVATELEAINLIEDSKAKQSSGGYTVLESKYTFKTKKSKGEIIDSWYIVTLTKSFED